MYFPTQKVPQKPDNPTYLGQTEGELQQKRNSPLYTP